MDSFNESHIEEAALEWFRELGYAVERESFSDLALQTKLLKRGLSVADWEFDQ